MSTLAIFVAIASVQAAISTADMGVVEATSESVDPQDDLTPADDKTLICKRQTIAGSRLRTREDCKTAEGWRRHKRETRMEFKRARSRVADTAK
ncbi:hypothetical protein GRI43_04835 [Altererythrobacter luteolus]|uniref:Uncharacterized protein n=1 Tax=Pontixanthobacter luteolus TaxID=295089 RepID=A0A6I4V1K3_9SPHN|nr:hypothetical protein [Pontixanthobacter luteolus]MXP46720.1 hypothetical protein [Pontixanthobacter luteolus]